MQKIIAIIPARGGSKLLKNKNIKKLFGKPLICYSIEIAKKCKFIDRVIVSSDSKKIIKIAKKIGAEAPFIRPKAYAKDRSTDYGVFKHCLTWLSDNENYKPDLVLHLRPTYPIRSLEILNVIKFYNMAYPMLFLPFVNRASEVIGKKILLEIDNSKFLLNYNKSLYCNSLNNGIVTIGNYISIKFLENTDLFEENEWKELYKLSENTFVEESDSLKKSGAGAGLTDND